MLNRKAGIMCDLTVTRLGQDRFWVLTGAGMGMHDLAWITSHMPADGSVQVTDVSSAFCEIGLWGPRARDLIGKVSQDDFSDKAFPSFTAGRVSESAGSRLAPFLH